MRPGLGVHHEAVALMSAALQVQEVLLAEERAHADEVHVRNLSVDAPQRGEERDLVLRAACASV